MKGILPKGPTRTETFERRWGALSTYNAEVARGIVHTPEYGAFMAFVQEEYDHEAEAGTLWNDGPSYIPPPGGVAGYVEVQTAEQGSSVYHLSPEFIVPDPTFVEEDAELIAERDPDTTLEGEPFIQGDALDAEIIALGGDEIREA